MTLYQTFDGPAARQALKDIFGEAVRIKQQGQLMGCVASMDHTGRAVTGMAVIEGHILVRFGPRQTLEGQPTVTIGTEVMTLRLEPGRHPGYPGAAVAQMVTDYLLGTDLTK